MDYQIRSLLAEDLSQLGPLLEQVDQLHLDWYPQIFRPAESARSLQNLQKLLQETEVLLAVACSEIWGAIFYKIQSIPDNPLYQPGQQLLIDNLVVDQQQRGQGLGQALVQRVIAEARAQGISVIRLNVYDKNLSARNLYQKLGFEPLFSRLEYRLH